MEQEIPLDQIEISDFDVRFYRSREFFRSLCEDIEREGVLVKPIVQKLNSHFIVLDGVTRILCVKKLGWKTIKCDVLDVKDGVESLILALKINLKRTSQDPIGVSETFNRLVSLGVRQKEIARRFGFSKSYVSKLIAIHNLSHDQKLELCKGKLSIPQAYALTKARKDPDLMQRLGVKAKCDFCHSHVDYSQVQTLQICSECERKLTTVLRSEEKRSERKEQQKELA